MTPRVVRSAPTAAGAPLALMVTRRCNMTCAHCSVESGPDVRGEPTESELLGRLREAAASGITQVRFTGGEPMLRPAVVLKLVREASRLGLVPAITTNGFWGASPARARGHLRALQRAGVRSVTVSYDGYHAEFQGPQPVLYIAQAAEELSLGLTVNVVRDATEAGVGPLMTRLESNRQARLRVYDLQPVGRANGLPAWPTASDTEGFCAACAIPTLTDDGRLIACPGPAYFERPDSPLVVGSLADAPLGRLLARHRDDALLDVIRTRGPAGLRDELRQLAGLESFPFRPRYRGICDLCLHITRSAEAVARLRQHLGTSSARAAQAAAAQVIAGGRQAGEFSYSHVNGAGAARLFFEAATGPGARFGPDASRVFGHAHLDWRRLTKYLSGCGLARPLAGALNDPQLARWAPGFVVDGLFRRGVADALREALQREAIGAIADALRELDGRGTLLKGAAQVMRTPEGGVARAASDVDLLVEPALAARLRVRLLERGFDGPAVSTASAPHHLEPIFFRGVPIEIHTRILPAYWGLPERDLLASVRPLPGVDTLSTLGPEASVLHAVVHLSASFFTFGLKTAWDVLGAIREPGFDWSRLGVLVGRTRAARAFWIPLQSLAAELALPVPSSFLAGSPTDAGARRLAVVARRRVYTAIDGLFELDTLTKAGLMLLVQDSWRGRAHYLGTTLLFRTSRPSTWRAAASRARRADLLRQPWRQFRRYRRATHPVLTSDRAFTP